MFVAESGPAFDQMPRDGRSAMSLDLSIVSKINLRKRKAEAEAVAAEEVVEVAVHPLR